MVIIVIGLIAALLFFAQQYLYQKLWTKDLSIVMKFRDETVRAGDSTYLTQVVENRKWLPLPTLNVKFNCSSNLLFAADKGSQVTDMYYRNDMFSLMPFRRFTRKHKVVCSKRGYYGIRGIDLVSTDLFLTQTMGDRRPGETWLYVLPALTEVEKLDAVLQKINGDMVVRRHLMADPFAFRGIREYTPFDELKTVNWKASAKSDELKVNIYDYSALFSVSIFLNVKKRHSSDPEEQIERTISIGAYLAEFYLTSGINLSFYANGRDIITGNILMMQENHNRKQFEYISKMLARIDVSQDALTFSIFEKQISQQKDRLIIIISPDFGDEFQNQLERIDPRQGFYWLCPCFKQTEVKIRESLKSSTILLKDMG